MKEYEVEQTLGKDNSNQGSSKKLFNPEVIQDDPVESHTYNPANRHSPIPRKRHESSNSSVTLQDVELPDHG